jgi:hypothetical protein
MSDIFQPAPVKPPSAAELAAQRGPRHDPIPTGSGKRKRRTRAEMQAAGAAPAAKPQHSSELVVFRACLVQIRQLKHAEQVRVVEMLKAVVDV